MPNSSSLNRLLVAGLISMSLLAPGCGGGSDGPVATGPDGAGIAPSTLGSVSAVPTTPTSPTGPSTPPTTATTAPAQQTAPTVSLFTVGGVLAGLGSGKSVVVAVADGAGGVLQNASLSANGAYSVAQVPAGSGFNLSITTQPVGQTCTITNGSGTVSANTNSLRIDCADNRYSMGGSVSGNIGLVALRNSATGEVFKRVSDGPFTFTQPVLHGSAYTINISVVDSTADQRCIVANASGTANATVTNVIVKCVVVAADAPPPAPPATPANLSVSYSVKSYAFAWSASASATSYELAEDPDGAGLQAEAQIGGTLAATNYSHSLTPQLLFKRLNATYRVRACNAGGCSAYTAALTPNLTTAIGYFKASNTGGGDEFGSSVALSADGNTLAVGALGERSNAIGVGGNQADDSAADSGAVYVFIRSAGAWSQQAYIKASNTGVSDQFGRRLSLSSDGNTLAVGAHREASAATGVAGNQADNSAFDSGAVYVFTRSAGAWTQQAYIKASNTGAQDRFGYSVALSSDGNTLAVGAEAEASSATGVGGNQADNSVVAAGAVYVFTRSVGAWSQQAYIKASNTGAQDRFGRNVALSGDGNTLAVGSTGEASNATGVGGNQTDNSAVLSGAVYMFMRSGGAWSQQAYVKASNSGAGDQFGSDVALSSDGNTLAVGASGEASNATGVGGNQADNSAGNAGAVYVFTRSAGLWSQQAYIKASNTRANSRFGSSIALSSDGNTLAAGALTEGSNATGVGGNETDNSAGDAGAVFTFTRSAGAWRQQAYIKASNTGAGDIFGSSVALSADGNTLAVGAPQEASNATGVGGNQADNSVFRPGAVYVY